MERPKKKNIEHSDDGECGCKYMDDAYPCQIEVAVHNDTCDEWEKYCEYLLTKIPSDEAIKKCPAPAYAYGYYQGQFDLLMDLIHPKK